MSVKISPEMFSNAVVITPTANDDRVLKNTINLKVLSNGAIAENNEAVGLLNLGNKGDNCVTLINFEIPEKFQTNYYLFWLVELSDGSIYIQKGYYNETSKFYETWVDDTLSFSVTNNNMLVALVEKVIVDNGLLLNGGNIAAQKEIFVSNEFMGYIEDNFLNSGWNGSLTVDEDLYVMDSMGEENPTEFHQMTWVNGETKLNAANMNNIMLGIQKAIDEVGTVDTQIQTAINEVMNEVDAKIQAAINGAIEEEY